MKIKTLKRTLTFLALLGFALPSNASEQALRAFLTNVMSMSAEFMQRVEDENGATLEVTAGKLYLSRPGKFRWDYKNFDFEGEPGQKIIADGESLFFYDPDLEQVTQRSLTDAMAQVPSLLLVQSGSDLDQHFNITDIGATDGVSWVALKPKAEDAGYQELMIGFSGELINILLLNDGLGNSTRLELTSVDPKTILADSMFDFIVPEGADLLRE